MAGRKITLLAGIICLIVLDYALSAEPIRTTHGCDSIKAEPAPDVAYRDGVDASGWVVAPADLSAPPLEASDFDHVGIGLNLPLRKYTGDEHYNLDASESELMLGTIDVSREGEATLNGKPLGASEPITDCGATQP